MEALVVPLLPVLATARTLTLRVQHDQRRWRIERTVHLGTTFREGAASAEQG